MKKFGIMVIALAMLVGMTGFAMADAGVNATFAKTELVKEVAKKTKAPQKEVEAVLSNFFDTVKQSVKKGDKVAIIGFGNFEAKKRAQRTGVNPKTRKKMTIPEKRVPVFRPGKAFKEIVSSK